MIKSRIFVSTWRYRRKNPRIRHHGRQNPENRTQVSGVPSDQPEAGGQGFFSRGFSPGVFLQGVFLKGSGFFSSGQWFFSSGQWFFSRGQWSEGLGTLRAGPGQVSPPLQAVPKISNKILTTPRHFAPAREQLAIFCHAPLIFDHIP